MIKRKLLSRLLSPEINLVVFFVLSIVVGRLLSRYFLDLRFLLSSTTIYVELGLIAILMTLLMVAGEIDLSVASIMTLTSCTVATFFEAGVPMIVLLALAPAIGAFLGLINGLLVTKTGLPSLIVTLGTMSLFRGIAQVLIGDHSIAGFPDWFLGVDRITVFGLFPLTLLFLIAIAIVAWILLRQTFFGRKILAIGLRKDVARYSTVNVEGTKLLLFVGLGVFCGVAGLLSMSRLQLARYNIGIGSELDIITMVLLGGTAFEGGRGNPLGTAVAFLTIVMVRTGMLLGNLSNHAQIAVVGGLLVVVLATSTQIERLRKALL